MNMNLFLIILTITTLLPLNDAKCHPNDESGLLAFKSGIQSDPSSILKTWITGTDCCTWFGVSCGDNKRVRYLSLYGDTQNPKSYLTGTISPYLSKLQYLDSLYLQDLQNISGPFPLSLLNLTKLQYIYIENNKLSGQIPKNIGTTLTQLGAFSLEGNRFTGTIPTSISELTQLTDLRLGNNLLTGTIPESLKNLKNLNFLSLKGNNLSGKIPDFFNSFTNLNILELSRNKFTGNVPVSISSMFSHLRFLELGQNSLSGKIPDFLGKFKALDTLDLSKNKFSGTVPESFANLTKIFNLDLSDNFLVDPFPSLNIKGIESLDLSRNLFHLEEIPKWVTSSPIIYSLKLAKCGIKMKLEDWKPSETYFYDFIDLSGNEISGSAVGLLNGTEYLVGFWGSENVLKFDLGGLRFGSRLKDLDLSHNLVFGKVGKSVVGIEKLNVSYNHLCGEIPKNNLSASVFVGNDCLCGAPLKPCKA
ncbi:leucine-rich repeat receptor-like serine/threonine-protein kinase SKM1 [Vicia villosa]|uniref:leucine-rich repeat receptor-like serine/threonine-protein kinase SKM1 n=1 Tax=Vicia villosa TaxID=3911 RepID=UPI00273C931E|nr:leucine-rich repeat receptor-like serine/threonine-protein kinase SKM1 [Vicia villosa]